MYSNNKIFFYPTCLNGFSTQCREWSVNKILFITVASGKGEMIFLLNVFRRISSDPDIELGIQHYWHRFRMDLNFSLSFHAHFSCALWQK